MNARDAEDLIRDAIPARGRVWADLGAGDGTFTRALLHVAEPSRVYAVDRDSGPVAKLRRWAATEGSNVIPMQADFSGSFELPEVLDGILLANALHYVPRPEGVLKRLVAKLRPGGRVVLVEYDQRPANPWVPHPISAAEWPALAVASGLSDPKIIARRPSSFGGDLYVATGDA